MMSFRLTTHKFIRIAFTRASASKTRRRNVSSYVQSQIKFGGGGLDLRSGYIGGQYCGPSRPIHRTPTGKGKAYLKHITWTARCETRKPNFVIFYERWFNSSSSMRTEMYVALNMHTSATIQSLELCSVSFLTWVSSGIIPEPRTLFYESLFIPAPQTSWIVSKLYTWEDSIRSIKIFETLNYAVMKLINFCLP